MEQVESCWPAAPQAHHFCTSHFQSVWFSLLPEFRIATIYTLKWHFLVAAEVTVRGDAPSVGLGIDFFPEKACLKVL
jgi:hypothetical protein